jgi:hypothetical protein
MADEIFRYDRTNDNRHVELLERDLWLEGRQHDNCMFDWFGDAIAPGRSYWLLRRGYQHRAQRVDFRQASASIMSRRPYVQAGVAGEIISKFTDEVLSTWPQLVVQGDEDTTALVQEMMTAAGGPAEFQAMRQYAGAAGAAFMVVEAVEGGILLTPRKLTDLYVRRWKDRRRWLPEDVIYQRLVARLVEDGGKIREEIKVATTRWTETEVIEYEDVEPTHDVNVPLVEREGGRYMHGAGRCPVVLHQNTRNPDEPEGQHDLVNEGNYGIADAIDRIMSSYIVGAQNNCEPTMWRADSMVSAALHPRLSKGGGNLINLSEKGKVGMLEIAGTSLEAAADAYDRLVERLQRNVSIFLPQNVEDVKTATLATKIWSSMQAKINKLRFSLAKTIREVVQVMLAMAEGLGVTSDEDPSPENKLVLPMRSMKGDDGEETWQVHQLGRGRTVTVHWPRGRTAEPSEIQSVLLGLQTATKGEQIISAETATAEACSALGVEDSAAERRRIEGEEKKRAERGLRAFGGFGGDAAAPDEDPGDEGAADDDLDEEQEGSRGASEGGSSAPSQRRPQEE